MAHNYYKIVPAVYLLLRNDEGKYLMARRFNTGYQDGNYNVPSGRIEEGELPAEALIREAKEEIGINVNSDNLQLAHVSYRPIHDDTGTRVDFFFSAKNWDGEIVNNEPDKCDELRWIHPDDLPANTTPHVKNAIACVERGEYFSELNLDFLKASGMYGL